MDASGHDALGRDHQATSVDADGPRMNGLQNRDPGFNSRSRLPILSSVGAAECHFRSSGLVQ